MGFEDEIGADDMHAQCEREIDNLRKAFVILAESIEQARFEKEHQWRDIKTAPLDGSHILLYRPEIQFVGYYGGANFGWCINAPLLPMMCPPPTHWMPIPKPPGVLK